MVDKEQKSDDAFGRKRKLENFGFVDVSDGEVITEGEVWEPHVQPIPLVTRDLVEAEQNRLVAGADINHRNRGESKTLKSDMMAFKAANPGASMADFVRWFSPADWVSNDEEAEAAQTTAGSDTTGANAEQLSRTGSKNRTSGQLSARMRNHGNEWAELWKSTQAVPAHRQEAVFDTATHSRQALKDLRNMRLAQLLFQLGVVLGSSATQLLHDAFAKPPSQTHVKRHIEHAKNLFRDSTATLALHIPTIEDVNASEREFELDANKVADASNALAMAEHMALCVTSLLMKLPPTETFTHAAGELARGAEFTVVTDRDRELLARMAGLDDGHWRAVLLPEYREFLLAGCGDDERKTDRMYARLSSDEFRTALQLGLAYEM